MYVFVGFLWLAVGMIEIIQGNPNGGYSLGISGAFFAINDLKRRHT